MKKRLLTVFLVAVFLLSLSTEALAAGSLSNFSRVNTYAGGMFTDVPSSQWYADEVQLAYEYGLVNGKSAKTYEPDSNLTIAEAIKMAAVMHSIYNTGKSSLVNGSPWYQPYVDYALQNKVISSPYAKYDAKATRADFAAIFAAALPAEALAPINQISDNSIPDVSLAYSYGPSVYLLYRAGVLTGSGETRAFKPNDNIRRSEVAAIAARMVNAGSRVTFSMSAKELTATEIAAKCSPAVFFIEVYDSAGKALGSGSGFFISSNGIAVTNYHVIKGAASAKIMTTDGSVYDVAGIYDSSEGRDLALLQINGSSFPYLEIGDSSLIITGATVYTIGSPKGLDNTFSQGIISNTARSINDTGVKFIQFDAAISRGSSGGALVNTKGQVIGVTTLMAADAQNLNFAVPSNLISELDRTALSPMSPVVSEDQYTVTSSVSDVNLSEGSFYSFTLTDDSNVSEGIGCIIENPSIITYSWSYWSSNSVRLYIYGKTAGNTSIRVNLYDSSNNAIASTKINVSVTPSNVTFPFYGPYKAPDFGAYVETPPYHVYYNEDLNAWIYFYRPDDINADLKSAIEDYFALLEASGFRYTDKYSDSTNTVYYFENRTYTVSFIIGNDFKHNPAICVSVQAK
jgi:S1-C subfamily serine protease